MADRSSVKRRFCGNVGAAKRLSQKLHQEAAPENSIQKISGQRRLPIAMLGQHSRALG
jgi:hypothetical protein